jgi:uncharacterized protein YjbI with pentapeptide repeats
MKVVKPMKLALLHRVVEVRRRPYFHVGAMLGFSLADHRALVDELAFWAAVSSALGAMGVVDEGFSKARGELLVAGSFHAPGGVPLAASYVRVKLGSVDKRLAVLGDRVWRDNAASAPDPFTTMPLDWARAFGGAKFDRNPYGKGAEPVDVGGRPLHPLPNVESYGALLRAPSDRPEPAGFLSMDVTFAQRRKRAGTHDKHWLDEHFPGLAPDAEPTFFNVAPEDQWLNGFFEGNEEFLIENMHPDIARIEGRLPGLVARCFVTHRAPAGDRFVEIPLRCDTVWLFPSLGLGVVISHGSLAVSDDDAADIVHLVAACEGPGSPRSKDHYHDALVRRLDKDKGAIADFSDTDLMPPRESGVAPNMGEMDIGQWVKSESLTDKNLRRGQEKHFAEMRERVLAQGLDPKDYGLAELPPEPEVPSVDDPDALAAHMEKLLARGDAEMKNLDVKAADEREKARKAFAEAGQDYDAMMAKAAKDSAGPPKFSAVTHLDTMHKMVVEAREGGVPLAELEQQLSSPTYRAELLQQEQGLRDMYVKFGHFQPTASALDPEAADRVRVLVQLAIDTGESLARRDFTGANLSGMRLAGVNLSGAFLEAADLSGCDLSRADLTDAVLAKANLRGADLKGAALRGANLGGAILCDAVLDLVDMRDGVLSRAELLGARFVRADLNGVDWLEAKLCGVDLSNAELGECNFLNADLQDARLIGTDLSGANFVDCTLDGADFTRARLHKTTFVRCKGERVSFREAHFHQGVMVHGSSFPGADFQDANLEEANFRGTSLPGARFDRAELSGADLSECDASGASFERSVIKKGLMIRTNLVGASLQGANLMDVLASKSRVAGANFTGANLYRADLSRVVGDAETTFAEAEVGHVRFLPKADVPPGGAS